MIEKVLVITKTPTSSAMPAKTWMMIVKNEKPLCTSEDSWSAASSPVMTSRSVGSACGPRR